MSEQELESIEERIEHWVGEREAVERSLDALNKTLAEIDGTLDDLREQADVAESACEAEEEAWMQHCASEEQDDD